MDSSIYVVSTREGAKPALLDSGFIRPSWSPDGGTLAMVATGEGTIAQKGHFSVKRQERHRVLRPKQGSDFPMHLTPPARDVFKIEGGKESPECSLELGYLAHRKRCRHANWIPGLPHAEHIPPAEGQQTRLARK
jgi:hypothetical protein